MKMKSKLLSVIFITFFAFTAISCSKEDNVPVNEAVGTFTGNLTVYPKTGPSKAYSNSILTITSAGEGKIKVSPAASTNGTPETFEVFSEAGSIVNPENDPKGIFIYYAEDKSLNVSTLTGTATMKFTFKGYKN